MTFNVISKWVLFPLCTSFSLAGVQLYCMCEADWSPLTCRGPLKDGVLSSGPWIVISWRNLLCICVVPNMMKFHQSVRKSIGFALFKAFSCYFFCEWLQYGLLWVIWMYLCILKISAVCLDICCESLYFKAYPVLCCLKWYVLWFHNMIYWVSKFK